MAKILEGIYAYVCTHAYSGEVASGNAIYTLTDVEQRLKGDATSSSTLLGSGSPEEINLLIQADQKVIQDAGPKIGGVGLTESDGSGSFDMSGISSYYYTPKFASDPTYGVIRCSTLRKSLKNSHLRGTKELSHFILFDKMPSETYAIDIVGSSHFVRDIALESDGGYATEGYDVVCEKKPEFMKPIFSLNAVFSSAPLKIEDIRNLGEQGNKEILRHVAEIFHALQVSKRAKKPLYIVFDPHHYDLLLSYLKITLKMLPARIANKIPFVTCLCKRDPIEEFGIYCIPTADREEIAALKERGFVISVTGPKQEYLKEKKGAFAEYLTRVDHVTFENWLPICLESYHPAVKRMEDMDDCIGIYKNGSEWALDPRSGWKERAEHLCRNILFAVDRGDLILSIEGEADRQLDSIMGKLQETLAALDALEIVVDVKKCILDPIFSLVERFGYDAVGDRLFIWLKLVLFGANDQLDSDAITLAHGRIVTKYLKEVKTRLGHHYGASSDYLASLWQDEIRTPKVFFDKYLVDIQFQRDHPAVLMTLLPTLLVDPSRGSTPQTDMRDYLVEKLLSTTPEEFPAVVSMILKDKKGDLEDEFNYIFDSVLRIKVEEEILNRWIDELGKLLQKGGFLPAATEYIKKRYSNQIKPDPIILRAFNVVIGYAFSLSAAPDLPALFRTYDVYEALVGGDGSVSLRESLLFCWYDIVIVPHYAEAIKATHFSDIDEKDIQRYNEVVKVLQAAKFNRSRESGFFAEFKKFLDEYNTYLTRTKRERNILDGRIEFVAREISLLDDKTILRILNKYLGAEEVKSAMDREGIVDTDAPGELSEFAKSLTVSYLSAELSPRHVDFCNEVHSAHRVKIRDYRIFRRDLFYHFLGSVIFTAIATLLFALISYFVYDRVGSYFRTIYVIFTIVIGTIAFFLYWSNYKNRRLRNPILMSLWEILLMMLATLGVYTLIQWAMPALGL